MVRPKLNKKKGMKNVEPEPTDSGIPIPDLPEKFLLMQVRSGSKIRNVLDYALKEFSNYNNVVWNAVGKAVGKAISCAEIFKTKEKNLHQITKIRFIQSKESKKRKENETAENVQIYHVPEIFILLAKEVKDTSVPGYQAPDDNGEFLNDQEMKNECKGKKQEAGSNVTRVDAGEFAAMGLRTGQKRPKKEQTKGQTGTPPKKSRKRANDGR
ncbi:ribonuclease P protein subunit p25-like protein [Bombus terrestris]|uniref:Ribonuclease P protein subunit p25-like protein n=1 Tax=Bombus terrestris TaxID=30195 RepID=A0A9C6VXQ5_BOMTE|nr:ribonuclease P protein subunit p25-like protein [Bombus terrestris]XP_048260324.1 ribonuclease P protein subunit p25-like protein [Bombus terrestris]